MHGVSLARQVLLATPERQVIQVQSDRAARLDTPEPPEQPETPDRLGRVVSPELLAVSERPALLDPLEMTDNLEIRAIPGGRGRPVNRVTWVQPERLGRVEIPDLLDLLERPVYVALPE